METILRFETSARMSHAVVAPAGSTVYLAGQVATDRKKGTREQTEEVLQKIDDLLAIAGASRDDIVSAMVWLADIADFDQMNGVWDAWVRPGHAPARACVQAQLAKPDIRVEIQVTALFAK